MKIPFDIKFRPQIESGEYKVVTVEGRPVRIICWNKKSEKKYGYHIVGLIEFEPNYEESAYYTIDGKGRLEDKEPCLFLITPEPEEKEEWYPYIKEKAAELLELAKDEIYSHESLVEYAKKTKEEETLTTPIPNLEEIVSELVKNYQS